MQFQYTPYIVPLLAASLVCGAVAVYAWLHRFTDRDLAFTIVFTALSILAWTVGYALELAGADLDTKYIWGVFQYFGIAFVPVGWFIFSIRYSAPARDLSRRFIFLTVLIPSITLVLALTTKWHTLIWTEYHISQQGNFSALEISHGTWFWVHWIYSYILLLIGTILLVRSLFRKQGLYRRQIIALIIAVLAPWIGNILYISGSSPIPYLDLTPFAFTITVAMLAWGIFGFRLIDLAPIARDIVVDEMGDGLLVLDARNRIVDINPAAQRMIGTSASQVIGRPTAEVFKAWPELLERYRHVQEVQDEITIGEGEEQRHFELRLAPLTNRRGRRIGQIITARDVSAQKQLQERLKHQNEYLSILHQTTLDLLNRRSVDELLQSIVEHASSLLDAPQVAMGLIEGDSLVVRAVTNNQPYRPGDRISRGRAPLSWKAYDTGEPVVMEDYATWSNRDNIYDTDPPHAVADLPIMLGKECIGMLSMGRTTPKYPFSQEQIETGISYARLAALVLDNANLYDSALKEIEERKQAEEALRLAETRYREIYESVEDVIYETDYHGILTSISPSVQTYTGSRPEELVGKPVSELFVNPNDYAALDSEVTIKGGLRDYEISIKGKNGEELIGSFNAHVLFDQQGQPVGTRGIARDITRLKRVQEALALSRDQALEASRLKSQLLANVSHELRTPLGSVLGFSELLKYEAYGALSDQQKGAIEEVIDSTNYLADLINDLLDQAKLEANAVTLNHAPFSPREFLDQVTEQMDVLANNKHLQLTAAVSADVPELLYGDVHRLRQILVNLVGNAIKFTKTGKVDICLLRLDAEKWAMQVADTGPGIPVEAQSYIFEPFRQVDGSVARQHQGTGLGLSIVQQLTELMDGKITLESEIDKGSVFTVILPIRTPLEG